MTELAMLSLEDQRARDRAFSERLRISDERLAELQRRIRPVVGVDENLHYIQDVDPREIAFTWSPRATKRARGLVKLTTIETIHGYGAPVYFKPSIAEVLAQIPQELIEQTLVFRTEHTGFTEVAAFTRHQPRFMLELRETLRLSGADSSALEAKFSHQRKLLSLVARLVGRLLFITLGVWYEVGTFLQHEARLVN